MTMVPSMSLVHGADDVALDVTALEANDVALDVTVLEADDLHRLSVDKDEDVAVNVAVFESVNVAVFESVNVAVFETHGGALMLMGMLPSMLL
jgi:hypothetical protein